MSFITNPLRLLVTRLLVIGLLGLLLPGTSLAEAATGQMDARDEPQISGPLQEQAKQCKDSVQRFDGRTVAKGSLCLTIFAFDPSKETDPQLDYGVLWAQSSVWTARRWCTSKVLTDILVPPELTLHTTVPEPATISEKTRTTVTLETDAVENSQEPASVAAEMILYPGELTRPDSPPPDPEAQKTPSERIRLAWAGLQSRKVAFASGVEVSWPTTESFPSVSYRLRYPVKKQSC